MSAYDRVSTPAVAPDEVLQEPVRFVPGYWESRRFGLRTSTA